MACVLLGAVLEVPTVPSGQIDNDNWHGRKNPAVWDPTIHGIFLWNLQACRLHTSILKNAVFNKTLDSGHKGSLWLDLMILDGWQLGAGHDGSCTQACKEYNQVV